MRRGAFLSVEPAEGIELEGLIAAVPGEDWEALDVRERGYARHHVGFETLNTVQSDVSSVQVYAVPDEASWIASPENPILLSYLDVVIQGYLKEFGEDGVARFFETTFGWDAQVLDDRDSPQYQRAQVLTQAETALVDAWIDQLSTVVQS